MPKEWHEDDMLTPNFFIKVVKESFNLFDNQQKRCAYILEKIRQKDLKAIGQFGYSILMIVIFIITDIIFIFILQ